MPCFYPIKAWRSKELTAHGKRGLVFKEEKGLPLSQLKIPCGRCIGCRLERSRQWAVRCMHEAKSWEKNCFVTLTYNDDQVPQGNTLVRNDLQTFMRDLRYRYKPKKIRFYACGEYGDQTSRPHYHLCLFNHDFEDQKLWKDKNGIQLFTSEILQEIWPAGFSTISQLTFESAAYTARYVLKKQNGESATQHYEYIDKETGELFDRLPEFNAMSLKPGIGANFFKRYQADIFPSDQVITRGVPTKPPRYYDKELEKIDPTQIQEVKKRRKKNALRHIKDSTPERLREREKVVKAKVKRNQRTL